MPYPFVAPGERVVALFSEWEAEVQVALMLQSLATHLAIDIICIK